MRSKKIILIGIVVIAFGSCVPKITVRQVNKTITEQYQNQPKDTVNTGLLSWKTFFSDQHLIALIDTSLMRNQELNMMLQAINISKNEVKARKGDYLPFVNYYAGAGLDKVGKYTRSGAVEENLNIREDEKFPEPLGDFQAGLSASWELDVWKKLRNAKKAAVLEYLSTIEGKNFMVTSLVAEIASIYYELIALDNQLNIIEQNLTIQRSALEMVRLQKQAARVSQLAIRRFEAEVLKNQSNRYQVKQKIIETENKINFLVGRYPQHIDRASDHFIDKTVDIINSGVPAQLLDNRPDIKRMELELAAAKLNVNIAKANFYPSIGIRANLGLQAFNPKYLVSTPESILFSMVGDAVGPLINRNAIKAEYRSANNKQLEVIYEYEKTVLNAYIEVATELSNIENLKESYKLKKQQVDALTEAIDLSIQLFKSARAEYTEVLLTQREALDSKIEIVETKRNQILANIKVYQALGGGWK